jgi:hypothetical protein
MSNASAPRRLLQTTVAIALFATVAQIHATNPDPKVMSYQTPDQIKWVESAAGSANAVLAGDPAKPGLYVVLTKWHPHHMSHPHFHPNDRFITVISGTWWVGWGPKWDPETAAPMKAGSVVTHFGKQIHWDGAKDEEVVLEIVGMGPATSTPAEVK